MTFKEAHELRRYILSKNSLACTVPTGGRSPDNYFATSYMKDGPREWQSKQEFRDWLAKRRRTDRKQLREWMRLTNGTGDWREIRRRPRSPIELMIDRACGLA